MILSPPRPSPTFLILGAAKSGTTSLCHLLDQHPDVCLTQPKEPVYFEAEFERGIDYYAATYLAHWSGQRAVGEGRVYNLFLPFVPARIRKVVPAARLVVILRDPVERAYSHWWHRVTRGNEQRRFEAVVEAELEHLERGHRFALATESRWNENFHANAINGNSLDLREVPIVEMGYYAEQLDRYLALFPSEQLLVLLFEDLQSRPDWVVERLCDHIGVEPIAHLARTPAQNTARARRKSALGFTLEKLAWSAGVTTRIPKGLRAAIGRLLSGPVHHRPPLSEAHRQRLEAHYAPHNEALARLIGRDLSQWSSGCSKPPQTSKNIVTQPLH